jgi:hypothetical protein
VRGVRAVKVIEVTVFENLDNGKGREQLVRVGDLLKLIREKVKKGERDRILSRSDR